MAMTMEVDIEEYFSSDEEIPSTPEVVHPDDDDDGTSSLLYNK